jgi:hypothetical protein
MKTSFRFRIRFTHPAVLIALLLFTDACNSNESVPTVYDVPQEFQSIIDQFQLEAISRGYDIQIDNLIIRYDAEVEAPYCATCNSKSLDASIQKIISINPDQCWLNDYAKEALIFHELGHCILGRDHDNTLLPNGDPKSMMVENNINVYAPCIYALDGDNSCNFIFKRDYYISELFDDDMAIPDWAKK